MKMNNKTSDAKVSTGKYFKKVISFLMFGVIFMTMMMPLAACHNDDNNDTGETKSYSMNPIAYTASKNPMKTGANVNLVVPVEANAVTGAELTAYVMLDIEVDNYNYYVVDWGDGTWSYNGPYAYNETHKPLGEVYHTYKKAGTYDVKAAGINLSTGTLYGWTESQKLTVKGEEKQGEPVKNVKLISSSDAGQAYSHANICDENAATFWRSKETDSVVESEYVGYLFDDYYTLDSLEIMFPESAAIFPSNIAIEYTTDGGESWYSMPRYYYVLPNAYDTYSVIMNFPNPMGATLALPMCQIAANGIRISSLLYPFSSAGVKSFSVSEMRVYGSREMLFYTSYDGYYNADLNNMWTIYGTAKTEPRMYNSLRGGATNVDPFRSGQTMTASIEWLEWDSKQLLWSGYDEATNILVNAMKNAVYGGDGWYYDAAASKYVVDESEYKNNKRDDGYIWATESSPQHLGEQNHYTYNSTLIIGARNYLLTGNNTAGFLQSVNALGQVMLDKIRKAAGYMVNDLDGKSGVMTIFDPRNDGTVHGNASNYWDSLNCFGYKSAYENILFYRAMQCMSDIENYLGNAEDAAYYTSLAAKIKQKFNETFWDSAKGRYITSININGDRLDFGFTFVNFMAVSYGLSSTEQTKSIYDWVDGKRIIEGDTSTGEDIYNFKVSARSNTVAVETMKEDGLYYWWYNGHPFNDVIPGHWGEYGNQMQNGGTIFYTSHYDISGRLTYSANDAVKRFNVIMDEFHKDELRRNPQTKFGGYQVSIVGEFPESGLVPLTFLTGVLGIEPDVRGLRIDAKLPSDMEYAGVNRYEYGNKVYSVEVSKSVSKPSVTKVGENYKVKLPASKSYYITLQNKLIEV